MSNLQQFYNMSSWRKETVTIAPHEVETIDFLDTNPNMFYIINPNIAQLKVGIGSIPRPNSYEFKVEPNTSEIVGRPEGSTKLYILNDSGLEITITVFSVNKEFDPAILKNMNVVLEGMTLETGSQITGIIDGLRLPTEEKNSYDISNDIKAILTLLNATGVTEYNSAAILNQLKALMTDNTTLSSILEKLNIIDNNTRNIEINADNIEAIAYDDTVLLSKLEEVKKTISYLYSGLPSLNDVTYLNNAIEFSYTHSGDGQIGLPEELVFDWLFNDGGLCNICKNGTPILTVFEGERFTDLKIMVTSLDTITITSDKPMYRIAYHVNKLPADFI